MIFKGFSQNKNLIADKIREMKKNILNKNIIKHKFLYLLILIIAILFPISYFPHIYGVDAFQVMWMANALRNGALFSGKTWLINPASYFGYFPFSHRAIGVPFILAFLIRFLKTISFGIMGLTEAIFVLDIILIIITYRMARILGNRLFEEEWNKLIFVAAILLSPNIIEQVTMTVSTRIIITIVMLVLLNLNLKILNQNENLNKFRIVFFIFLTLLIGALSHRLWLYTIVTILFMLVTFIIRKYHNIQYVSFFLIIPLAIISFFFGLDLFLSKNLFAYSFLTLINMTITYFYYFYTQLGIIFFCFPIGVIGILYTLINSFKNSKKFKEGNKKKILLNENYQKFIETFSYLLFLLIPFSFMIPTTFYAKTVFFPIIVIFSIEGLIYIKKLISIFSKRLELIFPSFVFLGLIISTILRLEMYIEVSLWDNFIFILTLSFIIIFTFLVKNYKNLNFCHLSFKLRKMKKSIAIILITVSILLSSTLILGINRTKQEGGPIPWKKTYITSEEYEIINFFETQDLKGLIFVFNPLIANRLGGVGFLPTFSESTLIGTPLYYRLITPYQVYQNTSFSLQSLARLGFFNYTGKDPIDRIRISIGNLDLQEKEEFNAFLSYNIQYIITANSSYKSDGINNWRMIQSLQDSKFVFSTHPVFETTHLLVWRIY